MKGRMPMRAKAAQKAAGAVKAPMAAGVAVKAPGKPQGTIIPAGMPNMAAPVPPAPAPLGPAAGTGGQAGIIAGATDGLGAGQGGLAIHPSAKGAAIHSREVRHTSKMR